MELYNLSADNMEKEYHILGSVLNFIKKYPFPDFKGLKIWYELFTILKIDVSVKQAANNLIVRNNYKNTNIKKYGHPHNFCKNHESRLKWEKTMLEEEGITNVFQRKDVIEKIINTVTTKYKKELWKHALTIRGRGVVSSVNKIIFNLLENEEIPFSIEFKVKLTARKYYSYDILLENNKIIEINGDYWHGNPKLYKPSDLILKGSSGEISVQDKWKKDIEKQEFIKNRGYQLLVLWEYDIKHNFEEVTQKIINYAK